MKILLTTAQTWFLYIGIIVASILIIAAILYFTCGLRFKREKKNKIEHIIVDETFLNDLISSLGDRDNIEALGIDNGRLKFKVRDLDILNTEILKTLSTSGVFITGNNVKLLFKYDSQIILEELNKRGIK